MTSWLHSAAILTSLALVLPGIGTAQRPLDQHVRTAADVTRGKSLPVTALAKARKGTGAVVSFDVQEASKAAPCPTRLCIPKTLLRHDRKVATPTRWCKDHRSICVQELTKRFRAKFKTGKMGRSHWTPKAIMKVRPIYKRAYIENRSAYANLTLTPQQAWVRYRKNVDCSVAWALVLGTAGHHFVCTSITVTRSDKVFITCESMVLVGAGVGAMMTAGPGAAVVIVPGTASCGVAYMFSHFLDW